MTEHKTLTKLNVLIIEDGDEYLHNLSRFVPGPLYLQAHNYPYSGNAAVSICNYEILKTLCYYTGVLDVEQRR